MTAAVWNCHTFEIVSENAKRFLAPTVLELPTAAVREQAYYGVDPNTLPRWHWQLLLKLKDLRGSSSIVQVDEVAGYRAEEDCTRGVALHREQQRWRFAGLYVVDQIRVEGIDELAVSQICRRPAGHVV